MQTAKASINWLPEPEAHNYPAAASYLSLLLPPGTVARLVKELRACEVTEYKAKDIFRASGLSLLGLSNLHIEKDREKIREGQFLSPILLVRDPDHGKVVIADGYHRLCAIYSFAEDTPIHCKITGP